MRTIVPAEGVILNNPRNNVPSEARESIATHSSKCNAALRAPHWALGHEQRLALIRAWLPARFVPPQVGEWRHAPSEEIVMLKVLNAAIDRSRFSTDDVPYKRSDIL